MRKNRPIAVTVLLAVLLALTGCATPAWSQGKTVLAKEEMNVVTPIVSRGTTCTDAALTTALTAIGSSEKRLLLSPIDGAGANCTWTIANNLTIPRNVTLVVPQGAKASINTARTLTLNGPLQADDPAWHSGAGSVVLNYRGWSPDTMVSYIASGCTPTVPGASLTLSTFACLGFINDNGQWYPTFQITSVVGPLNSGDGTYWVALYRDLTATVAGWTRQASTYYLWQKSATRPATPNGGMLFAQVTVAAGAITVVGYIGNPNPLNSTVVSAGKNVKECGAKVDGVTDDTVALNTCLQTYSHVFVPEGVLIHSGSIIINMGNRLSGINEGAWDTTNAAYGALPIATRPGSTLRYTGSGTAVKVGYFVNSLSLAVACQCVIENIAITSRTGAIGLGIDLIEGLKVFNVMVHGGFDAVTAQTGFTQAGIKITCAGTNPANEATIKVTLDHLQVHYNLGYGLLINDCQNMNVGSLTNSVFRGNGLGGLFIEARLANWDISRNAFEGNGGNQVYCRQCEGGSFTYNFVETGSSPLVWMKYAVGYNVSYNAIRGAGSGTTAIGLRLGYAAEGLLFDGGSVIGNAIDRVGVGVYIEAARATTVSNVPCAGAGSLAIADLPIPIGGPYSTVEGINWLDCGAFDGKSENWAVVSGQDNSLVTVSSATAETTVYTHTVKANSLGTRGGLQLTLIGSYENSTPATATDLTVKVKLGAVTLNTLRWQGIVQTAAGASHAFQLHGVIMGSVGFGIGHQACSFTGKLGAATTWVNTVVDTGSTDRFSNCSTQAAGADMTIDNILTITAQHSLSNAAVIFVKESVSLTRLPY